MTASAFASQVTDLARLSAQSGRRTVSEQTGVDFSSNDYLGLARSPLLAEAVRDALARGVPIGSGGSRLLRGNDPEHEALEAEAAVFFGCERVLSFSNGFSANQTLFSTLPQRGDLGIRRKSGGFGVHRADSGIPGDLFDVRRLETCIF